MEDVRNTWTSPQSTSLVLHDCHVQLTLFFNHVSISENDKQHTSRCINNSSNIASFDSKVNQFFIIIVFGILDELLLHHDVCCLSFSEILTWLKKSVNHTWQAWRTNEVDWGSVQVFPTSSTRPPRHFWPKDGKRSRPTRFGCWIRTTTQHQLLTDATDAYRVGLGRSSTSWNHVEVNFHMDPDSCPYLS